MTLAEYIPTIGRALESPSIGNVEDRVEFGRRLRPYRESFCDVKQLEIDELDYLDEDDFMIL
tara:strand:+ start:681 stop:866 length:186 start_codon:yes stop_codon:yes gene_type:complete